MLKRVLAAVVGVTASLGAQEFATFLPNAPAEFRETATGAIATRAAVLVAADTYRNLPADSLPAARSTADDLRDALTEHGGFAPGAVRILSGDEVHGREVRAAILVAASRVRPSDDGLLLLSWAGHGWVQGRDVPEQFLLTHYSDEQGDAFSAGIAVGQLVTWLGEARAAAARRGVALRPVLLIDACRTSRGAPPRKVKAIPRAAWQVYGSSQGQMVAAGQGRDPFLFTGTLSGRLRDYARRGGVADLAAVFGACRDATRERSRGRQVPELIAPAEADLATAGAPAMVVPRRVALTVRCVDALADTPIVTATLRINDDQVEARDGRVQRLLAPARVVIAARAEGYLGRTDEVDLARVDAGAEVTLRLTPQVAVVRGRLVPPATARVVFGGRGVARTGFHVVEKTTSRDGVFELRVPALAGSELRVVQQGRVLQRFALPAQPGGILADRAGRHDGVPLVEIACELDDATLGALGADAPPAPAAGEPRLSDPDDRIDWEQARQAIERKRWDLARSRLRRIRGDPERVGAMRQQVEARWAISSLERVLADGKATGDWGGLDELRAWWDERPAVDDRTRIEALFAEVEREKVPLAVRRAYEAGNEAYADGELEDALVAYQGALGKANAHYRAQIEQQCADIRRRLYRRYASVAFQAELDGNDARALDAYGSALAFSERVREDVERLLRSPALARTPRGRELSRRLGVAAPEAPETGDLLSDWDCTVLDASPGDQVGHPRQVRDNRSGIVFVLVPSGAFEMGSTAGDEDEQPPHLVQITAPFYLAETETTQAQWNAVMGTNQSRFDGAVLPVENISWSDAQEFLRKLNGGAKGAFRLPTEAEWEYACRAGTTTVYAFGDEISTAQANYAGQRTGGGRPGGVNRAKTIEVGSFEPNAWGLYDMHGNVWEWCQDWFDEGYYHSCRDGVTDPQGPATGRTRVIRGGAWRFSPVALRSAARTGFDPAGGNSFGGVRVARTLARTSR